MSPFVRTRLTREELRAVMRTDLTHGIPRDSTGFSLLPPPVEQDWEPDWRETSVMAAFVRARRDPKALTEFLVDGLECGLLLRLSHNRWAFAEHYVRRGTDGRAKRDRWTRTFSFSTDIPEGADLHALVQRIRQRRAAANGTGEESSSHAPPVRQDATDPAA